MSAFTKPIQLLPDTDVSGFCCGDTVVDNWFHTYAPLAKKHGTAVVYVSYCGPDIAGFYTLSAHSVERERVSGGWFVRNTPEQVPVVLLGMLGVDRRFQGKHLGASLLKDALTKALKIADLAGAKALVVDPSTDEAAAFYARYGFATLPGTNRMALKLQ